MKRWMGALAMAVALGAWACGGSDDDGNGGMNGGGGGKSACVDMWRCMNACPPTEEEGDPCGTACVHKHGLKAGSQVTALIFCGAMQQCEDAECLVENCSDQMKACGIDAETYFELLD